MKEVSVKDVLDGIKARQGDIKYYEEQILLLSTTIARFKEKIEDAKTGIEYLKKELK